VSAHISALVSFFPAFSSTRFYRPSSKWVNFSEYLASSPLPLHVQDQLYNTTRAHYDLAISAGKETSHFADLNFQPSNDMATYAVPANSITVNMHIPIMLQQIVT